MTTREAIRQAQRNGRFREAAELYAAWDRENEKQMKSQTKPLDLVVEWIEQPAKESTIGIHTDMSRAEYDSIQALNSTGIRKAIPSALAYRRHQLTPQGYSYELEFGKAFALRRKRVDEFYAKVAIGPTKTPTSKEWQRKVKENPGMIYVLSADIKKLVSMEKAVLAHPIAGKISRQIRYRELVAIAEHPTFSVLMKGAIDSVAKVEGVRGIEPGWYIIDDKTIAATEPLSVRVINRYRWKYTTAEQLYIYRALLGWSGFEHEIRGCLNIFVEKRLTMPDVAVRMYSDNELDAAGDTVNDAITRILDAEASGNWCGCDGGHVLEDETEPQMNWG